MKRIEVVAGIICSSAPTKLGAFAVPGQKFLATQRGYGEFKDGWEFPGGKMEPGESREKALVRELKEELAVDVNVGDFLCTVEYDYPTFHLTMHCFFCSIAGGKSPELLEHEAAKWLTSTELHCVDWLPADVEVVKALERNLRFNS